MIPSPLHILLVIVLIIVLFGANRVPGIAENLAKGIKAFKKGLKDEGEDTPEAKITKIAAKDD